MGITKWKKPIWKGWDTIWFSSIWPSGKGKILETRKISGLQVLGKRRWIGGQRGFLGQYSVG